jgi:hypothetical protein
MKLWNVRYLCYFIWLRILLISTLLWNMLVPCSFVTHIKTNRTLRWKVKVKLSPCFNWASRHEGVSGKWKYSSTRSLISALDGCEWSVSRYCRLNHREEALGTYWIGGWVGPEAGLDAVVKRKIPSPRRDSNHPIIQPHWAMPAPQREHYRGKTLSLEVL